MRRKGQILIQNDVWIGRGATIMSGVTIHNGAVISADAVVTKDVAPYSIVGGNPAQHIKFRFEPETIEKLLAIQWWYWSQEYLKKNIAWFSKSVEEFASHFYGRVPSIISNQKLNIEKESKQFLYFPDFEAGKYNTWQQVISEFCKTFQAQENYCLLLFLPKEPSTEKRCAELCAFAEKVGGEARCYLNIYAGDKEEETAIFQYADYYVTNRSADTVYHSCVADMLGVKTLSCVDLPLFSGIE